MPIASKRRPDTLELEVLRTSEAPQYDKTFRDVQSKRKRINENTDRISLNDNVLEPLQCADYHDPISDKTLKPPLSSIQRQRSSHWYQFGNKLLRRCSLIGRNDIIQTKRNSLDEVSDCNTARINVNVGTATLAKPEPTIIGNSTSTILTTTPPTTIDSCQYVQTTITNAVTTSTPNVVTILPRTNSKKRRRSKTENLYSLNNIEQIDDVVQSPIQGIAATVLGVGTIPVPSSSSSYPSLQQIDVHDRTLLTDAEPANQKPIPFIKSNQQDIETNVPLVKSDVKVNFISFLSRLTHWKANNCQRNHKHMPKHPYQATNNDVDDDIINADDNYNTVDGTSLDTQKSFNFNKDFNVLPSHANETDRMISLSNVKEKGIRRLSQIRRRRSSFYHSASHLVQIELLLELITNDRN